MACVQGGCDRKGRRVCQRCRSWRPTPGSRYYKCARFIVGRILCTEPRGTCRTCVYRVPEMSRGRPAVLGIEASTVYNRNEYMAEYMRIYRRTSGLVK